MSPLNRFKLLILAWIFLGLGLVLLSEPWKFFGSIELAGIALIVGAMLCATGSDWLVNAYLNRRKGKQ